MITIKFVIATSRLNNKREKNKHKFKAKKFVNNNKIDVNKQIPYANINFN